MITTSIGAIIASILIALSLGVFFGVLIMCVMQCARRADDHVEGIITKMREDRQP
jgi:hypothetical protein